MAKILSSGYKAIWCSVNAVCFIITIIIATIVTITISIIYVKNREAG